MKAVLDHVGIAVSDLQASLAFFKDVLGLHVEETEEVAAQRVRATFLGAGQSTLEMLEATSPESAIAKFIEKRGVGMHHIALRVDDIEAALAHLKSRGIRLIDEKPRPGAEGALVAFIHPSQAHGVLVELKQPRPKVARFTNVVPHTLGNLELISLSDGFIGLDGGAMFGVVPKTLWERRLPADARNRIPMGMRVLLVEHESGLVLIDSGSGNKETAKFQDIYGIENAGRPSTGSRARPSKMASPNSGIGSAMCRS